jgi:hypothetical protein
MLASMHIVWHIKHRIGYYVTYIFFTNLTSVWGICCIRLENKRKEFEEKDEVGEKMEIL